MASRRARVWRWVWRSAGGQTVASSSRKSEGMSRGVLLAIFLAATGQAAQRRVLVRDIVLNSFQYTEHEKPPGTHLLGACGFMGLHREYGCSHVELAEVTPQLPAASSPPPCQRCSQRAATPPWRAEWQGHWRAGRAA